MYRVVNFELFENEQPQVVDYGLEVVICLNNVEYFLCSNFGNLILCFVFQRLDIRFLGLSPALDFHSLNRKNFKRGQYRLKLYNMLRDRQGESSFADDL